MSAEREMIRRLVVALEGVPHVYAADPLLVASAWKLLATPDTAEAVLEAARDHEMYATACDFPSLHGAVLRHDAAQKEAKPNG